MHVLSSRSRSQRCFPGHGSPFALMTSGLINHINSDPGLQTLSYLKPRHICAIRLVSKHILARSTTSLYTKVDISLKRNTARRPSINHRMPLECAGMAVHQESIQPSCFTRQRLFCGIINSHPEIAHMVRELKWTLDVEEFAAAWNHPKLHEHQDDFTSSYNQSGAIKCPIPDIWNTFRLLTMVNILTLNVVNCNSTRTTFPPMLFPNAKLVRLSGPCPANLFVSILFHNARYIKKLALDSLSLSGWSILAQSSLRRVHSLIHIGSGRQFDLEELAKALELGRMSLRRLVIGLPDPGTGVLINTPSFIELQTQFEEIIIPVYVHSRKSLETLIFNLDPLISGYLQGNGQT